jgi:Protein of unknown function (DUF1214)
MEVPDARPRRKRLVDEYRHDGRLRQLLLEEGDHRSGWTRGPIWPRTPFYPFNLADNTGKPLDGSNRYTLHFDKGETPPANAFWSVTLYDAEGFPVAMHPTGMPLPIGCRSSTTPTGHSISTSKTRARPGQRNELAARAKAAFNLKDLWLCFR